MTKTISIVLSIVLTALIIGGGVYYLTNRQAQATKEDLENQISTLQNQDQTAKETKEISARHIDWKLESKIPSTWSVFRNSENSDFKNYQQAIKYDPWLSIGKDNVTFLDINWTQADIYIIAGDKVDDTVATVSDSTTEQSTQEIDGVTAKVVATPSTNNGVPTREKSGAQLYIFSKSLDDTPDQYFTVVISKQSTGDDMFESGFNTFIKDLTFTPVDSD